jgi:hypothetical protein
MRKLLLVVPLALVSASVFAQEFPPLVVQSIEASTDPKFETKVGDPCTDGLAELAADKFKLQSTAAFGQGSQESLVYTYIGKASAAAILVCGPESTAP